MKSGWKSISVGERLIYVDQYGQHRQVTVCPVPKMLVDDSGSHGVTRKNGPPRSWVSVGHGEPLEVPVEDLWRPNNAPEKIPFDRSNHHLIGFAGDWHGSAAWAVRSIKALAEAGCRTFIHVGDFGFEMAGTPYDYIEVIDRTLDVYDMDGYFIDGNHENHHRLNGVPRDGSFGLVSKRLRHARRGARWEIAGLRFGALGGTASVDRNQRTEGFDWWRDEAPTAKDVQVLGRRKLDVLVTHDTLDHLMPMQPFKAPVELEVELRAPRLLIERALRNTRPWLMVHGHWHHRYTHRESHYSVEGLDRDGSHTGNLAVLDPATRRFESLAVPYSTVFDTIIG